jgi:hypothetical protein
MLWLSAIILRLLKHVALGQYITEPNMMGCFLDQVQGKSIILLGRATKKKVILLTVFKKNRHFFDHAEERWHHFLGYIQKRRIIFLAIPKKK